MRLRDRLRPDWPLIIFLLACLAGVLTVIAVVVEALR